MQNDFDKKRYYEEVLAEKVFELKRLCHMEKIPMFITLCLTNDQQKTVYEKEMVSAATCGYRLTDDQIAKHVNVSLGFDTVQPSQELTMEMDDMSVNYIENEEEQDDAED